MPTAPKSLEKKVILQNVVACFQSLLALEQGAGNFYIH